MIRAGAGGPPPDYVRINGQLDVVDENADWHCAHTQKTGAAKYTKDYYGSLLQLCWGVYMKRVEWKFCAITTDARKDDQSRILIVKQPKNAWTGFQILELTDLETVLTSALLHTQGATPGCDLPCLPP